MAEKLVTISLPEELLRSIDRVTRRRGPSRAALILKACEDYVRSVEKLKRFKKQEREAVRRYIKGYSRFPETAPDPDEWAEVYKAWLAEHPETQ
ncbi:MAG TPA: ribbon-helix-helix protein, CopG family [Dehalococcoidia bacterium]|jgi:metal-responsive CopG/Arc/MetJ family transcriptional regulator